MPCLTQATPACELVPLRVPTWVLSLSWSMDAIDRVVMNSRLHYLGMAARIVNPMLKLALGAWTPGSTPQRCSDSGPATHTSSAMRAAGPAMTPCTTDILLPAERRLEAATDVLLPAESDFGRGPASRCG